MSLLVFTLFTHPRCDTHEVLIKRDFLQSFTSFLAFHHKITYKTYLRPSAAASTVKHHDPIVVLLACVLLVCIFITLSSLAHHCQENQYKIMSSSGNDDSDRDEEEVTISEHAMDLMELAKYTIDCLERRIRSAGDNDALVASAVLEERSSYCEDLAFLGACVTTLKNRAYHQAVETWQELLHFLDNHDTWPVELFWDNFDNKLVELGETSVEFRKACFHNTIEEDGDNYFIFHLVSKLTLL